MLHYTVPLQWVHRSIPQLDCFRPSIHATVWRTPRDPRGQRQRTYPNKSKKRYLKQKYPSSLTLRSEKTKKMTGSPLQSMCTACTNDEPKIDPVDGMEDEGVAGAVGIPKPRWECKEDDLGLNDAPRKPKSTVGGGGGNTGVSGPSIGGGTGNKSICAMS